MRRWEGGGEELAVVVVMVGDRGAEVNTYPRGLQHGNETRKVGHAVAERVDRRFEVR